MSCASVYKQATGGAGVDNVVPPDLSKEHLKSLLLNKKNVVSLVYLPGNNEVLTAVAWSRKGREIKIDAAVGANEKHNVSNFVAGLEAGQSAQSELCCLG